MKNTGPFCACNGLFSSTRASSSGYTFDLKTGKSGKKSVIRANVLLKTTSTPHHRGQQDSVGKRLYDKGIVMRQQRERREKSEELRKKGEERKAKKARPWVTEMAQGQARDNFTQFLHVQGKWENQKKFKLAQKSEERDKEDTGNMEVKRKWQMCPVSESIIDRKSTRGDYKGPQSGWKASFSKYIKSKNLEEVAEQDFEFEPTINISSKQIVRDVPTHERLHALAAEREESLLVCVSSSPHYYSGTSPQKKLHTIVNTSADAACMGIRQEPHRPFHWCTPLPSEDPQLPACRVALRQRTHATQAWVRQPVQGGCVWHERHVVAVQQKTSLP